MILSRILFRRRISLALDSVEVNEHRPVILLCRQKYLFNSTLIVTVHRSKVDEAEVLEQGGRVQQRLPHHTLGVLDDFRHRRADDCRLVQAAFHRLFRAHIALAATNR